MKNNIKKIALIVLVSLSLQIATPTVTYAAGWPTWDAVSAALKSAGLGMQGTTTAQSIMKTLKDFGLDQVAYALAQKLGAKMANKLVNKANGGASGDSSQPSYITNFTSYFSDLQLGQVDKFITDLSISKNPFSQDIAQSLIQNASGSSSELESFDLDTVIGPNYKDFADNTSVGGWAGIMALSNPANTNIGASLIAKTELANKIEAVKEIEKIKLSTPGTKPQGKCNLDFQSYKDRINTVRNSNTTASPVTGGNNAPRATTASPVTGGNQINQNQANQNAANNAANQNAANNAGSSAAVIGAVSGLAEDYGGCLNELINNPVALVTSGVDEATKYALKQTQNIQGWGQIVAGIFVSMFGSFVKTGLSSLSSDFTNSNSSNVGGPEQLIAKNGQAIPWTKAPTIIIDMQESFPDAINLTESEITLQKKYIYLLTEGNGNGSISESIAALDNCVPGPDYRYETRMDAYISMKTGKLMRKQAAGKNEKKQEARADAGAAVDAGVEEAKAKMTIALINPRQNIPGALLMTQEIARMSAYRQKYQEKNTALEEKQATLNMLYKIEGDIKISLGALQSFIPNIPSELPFSNKSWQYLPVADRTKLVTWATKITGRITPVPAAEQRDFVIDTAWSLWSSPSKFMVNDGNWETVDPTTGKSKSTTFLENKNQIRSNFNSLAENISIQRTIDNARLDSTGLENSIKRVGQLVHDCSLEKTIIMSSPLRGAENHDKILDVLKSRKNEFLVTDMRLSLDGPSILKTNIPIVPDGFDCDQVTGECAGLSGDLEINDEDGNPTGDLGSAKLQIQPPKDVWETIAQDSRQQLFCYFNQTLATYPDFKNVALGAMREKQRVLCSPGADWYTSDQKDLIGYLFGDSYK